MMLNPKMKTASAVVGVERAWHLVRMLMTTSQWFAVMPLPDGKTEISVREENANLLVTL